MIRQIIPAIAFVFFLSSCSTFRPLNFTSSRQISSGGAQQAKFIDDISITPREVPQQKSENPAPRQKENFSTPKLNTPETRLIAEEVIPPALPAPGNSDIIESASPVQLKYAVLMNTDVESLPNKVLLESVDPWYGGRYRTGGNSTSGIDCSGFTVAVYAAAYGIALPRVSRDQYRISRKVSITELQEGDLVFFNTRGSGVSHVGVYLGNNKFIHATVSRGVMVNDLFESYYVKRFIGAGRIDDKQVVACN